MVIKKKKKRSSKYEPFGLKVYLKGSNLYIKSKRLKGKYTKIAKLD